MVGRLGLPWALAALFVAGVARHTALLPPCPASQGKPILPYTHLQSALDDVGSYSVFTVDISLTGLCLHSQHPLVIGRNYAMALAVPDGPRRTNAWSTVVYCDGCADGFYSGIRFLDMDAYGKAGIEDLPRHHDEWVKPA
ncbi:PilZ domain-containing protein [Noviherbaspirillum aerium]|uniref:PilZ domain-containing protein n=1 Tax=Noviherbaspirillum aerium TaxID=2588497 RepID=UPI00124F2EB4|nr:PilZ domain-containing protein [Noviherbaspirillum aerium]